MLLRWIYNIWNFLLKFLGYLLLVVVIVSALALVGLQLPISKSYIGGQLVNAFNEQYSGDVSIESIEGFIPFRTQLNNVTFTLADSLSDVDHLRKAPLSVDELYMSLDVWQLLQGSINITELDLRSPDIRLSRTESGLNIQQLFSRQKPRRSQNNNGAFITNVSIFAPQILLSNGQVNVDSSFNFPSSVELPDSLLLTGINASFFVESLEEQQFVEINSFEASTNIDDFSQVNLTAQFFTNRESLEVNALDIRSESAVVELSVNASPINVFQPNVQSQLEKAFFELRIDRINLQPELLSHLREPEFTFDESVEMSGTVKGTLDTLFVDNLQIIAGESYLITDGVLTNVQEKTFGYDFSISNLVVTPQDVSAFFPDRSATTRELERYGQALIRGDLAGSLASLEADLSLETDLGGAEFESSLQFNDDQSFSLNVALDSLDLSPLLRDSVGTTFLNGSITATGRGYDKDAAVESTLLLSGSKINTHNLQSFNGNISYNNQSGEYTIGIVSDDTEGSASGTFGIGATTLFQMDAVAENLNLVEYFPGLPYTRAEFDGVLFTRLTGTSLEDFDARLTADINESIVNSDTLRAHQLYMDINNPEDGDPRQLRFTSSFLNIDASGTLYADQIASTASYWYDDIISRINEELFFEEKLDSLRLPGRFKNQPFEGTTDLSINIKNRDLQLLKAYIPSLPDITSNAEFTLNINATEEKLSLNGSMFDDSLSVNNSSFDDINLNFTGNFTHGEPLKKSTYLNAQINSPDITLFEEYDIDGASLAMSLRDSNLTVRQQIDGALENLFYYGETSTLWTDNQLQTTVDSLSIGSSQYAWRANGAPGIIYNRNGSLTFDDFVMESNEDFFEVDGTFSSSYEDSVLYNISNFDLGRVSDLIGGRIQFEGVVNGEFTTRALTSVPSIQGDIRVDNGQINNRLIGDVTLESRFNPDENQFDTELHIYTDPEKYTDYIQQNDGIGNDLFLKGYFKTPDQQADEDTDLVYFDADFREIDMWIVTFIVPNIISEMEGSGEGSGYFKVDSTGYNFEANFDVEEVYGVPAFTNVPYTLGGELTFNREDGLIFRDIQLDDVRGGSGTFSGTVDLDDFSPMNYLDLRMEIEDLRFMNNEQDPNVPFYADLTGTGTAVLQGSSQDPSLRSLGAIRLASNSDISIPLQEETELQQDRRFVSFVDSFEEGRTMRLATGENGTNGDDGEEDVDLTFVELFTLDLQFQANNPIDVRLIFDPVTNDILEARGTGRIRLRLEDQDVSMFGTFNISDGQYQFVGGDIFTRQFNIQDGGTISWQGDLIDANLDVTAVYRARPDISTLIPTGASFQRIPIELILEIGGTISQIENDFFFQLPSGIEGTQDPTIEAQINRLNQNEEEKVLQAFGILLTGNFVPSNELHNPEFGNVTGTNTLVNPLLSSQIISPLLSNQINSLLRSDITFDVDFNLNAFNEVDLGVALRLFNDRIVLRREGQITGESEIGDLGATYRINQIFSITAFHRQDVTLSNRSETESRQTQEMNGMGVEAQFQFNTWQNLKNRIVSSIRRLFGIKEEDTETAGESESLADN